MVRGEKRKEIVAEERKSQKKEREEDVILYLLASYDAVVWQRPLYRFYGQDT